MLRQWYPSFIALFGLGLGSGCGAHDPWDQDSQRKMPDQDHAFALVKDHLKDHFPTALLIEPDVRWWTDFCPGTSRTAVILGGRCYSGLTYRREGIDVAYRGTIGESAYAHELMHHFLDRAGYGADPLHLRAPYWEMVLRIDTILQDQGR